MRKYLVILCVALACVAGGFSYSQAETDLENKKAEVDRKLAESSKKIAQVKGEVQTAEERVAAAQAKLDRAKQILAKTQAELQAARSEDSKIGEELARAEADLTKAQTEVVAGEERVAAQRELIGKAVKEAYQQRSDLVGVSVVLGAEGVRDLASRLQWQDTVFSSTAAQMRRLEELQVALEKAEAASAEIAKVVAEKKEVSAAVVAKVRALVAAAAQQTEEVSGLVKENQKVRDEAAGELSKELAHHDQLAAESAEVGEQIRAEIEARRKAEGEAAKNNQPVPPPAAGPSSSGLVRPVTGRITSSYGYRANPFNGARSWHSGTDFGNACGHPIKAAAAGQVKMARWNGGYGNYIRLDNGTIGGKAITTAYGHLSRYAVSAGDRVEQGQVIGYVGTTGASTGCHLHFEVWVNGSTVDPMSYL